MVANSSLPVLLGILTIRPCKVSYRPVLKKTSYPILPYHSENTRPGVPPVGKCRMKSWFLEENWGEYLPGKFLTIITFLFESPRGNTQKLTRYGKDRFPRTSRLAWLQHQPTIGQIAETSLKNRIETWQTTALNHWTPKAGQSGINFSNLLFGIVICRTIELNCWGNKLFFRVQKRHPT